MTKKDYESPTIEIVEFEIEDSIASSSDTGSGAVGTERIWDDAWDD